MPLPPDFVQHVKTGADIVRVVGESVRLKKAGNNWIGLCPFHQEKTPSFHVHATRQFYYCFGCGAKGDVFRFVMETEKVDFPEALKRVAQRSGISVPAEIPRQPATPEARLRTKLLEAHESAASFFRQQLRSPAATSLRNLMARRGLTEQSIEEFGLGYAPGSGDALARFLQKEGFSADVLKASGLAVARDAGGWGDRFRNRWIFPLASETGQIIAFAARALGDEQPKYLNSPETPLYSKSRTLYNLSRARENVQKLNSAVLVEGYMDAIAAHQAGVKNVVASCGTALTAQQVQLLSHYASEAVINYDPDTAGVAAADRAASLLLEEGFAVKMLRLGGGPGKLDPDEFIRTKGAEAYRKALQGVPSYFHYLANRALELHGQSTTEAKLASLNFILPYVSKVPNALIRSELLADIAQKIGVQTAVVSEAFRKAGMSRRARLEEPPGGLARIPTAEAMLIRLLLEDEAAREETARLLQEGDLVEEMQCAPIVSTLLGMMSAGVQVELGALTDRLPEDQQRLLAEMAFNREARPVSRTEIESYIFALERKRLLRRRGSLQKHIQEAEKARDSRRAVELLEEQRELDRKLAALL